jgi:uncharacterized protein YdeI (YjbR/CyaY-like superfamily)
MTATFFETQIEFRKWLEKHHKKETELIVGYYKVDSGKPSMTWSQSVDQALCFGWIDGVRKSIDKESYQIRFTPRKLTSIWSAINIQKIAELTNQGLMYPAGLEIFEKRRDNNSNGYSSKDLEVKFSSELEKQFKANKKAWAFFQSLPSSYRKPSVNWVMSAKQETTKLKRLNQLISESQEGTNQWKDNKYKKK